MNQNRVLIIGGNGFIGRFLSLCLKEKSLSPIVLDKNVNHDEIDSFFANATFVFDCHGLNRSADKNEFYRVNCEETAHYALLAKKYNLPYVFLSTIQSGNGTPYGDSKKAGEEAILSLKIPNSSIIHLPNIYGPSCLPNYNSVIATWIHYAILQEKEKIILNKESKNNIIPFLYVADLTEYLVKCLLIHKRPTDEDINSLVTYVRLEDVYRAVLHLTSYEQDPLFNYSIAEVPYKFLRNLYGIYLYEKNVPQFIGIHENCDERGTFAEVFKGGFHAECQFSLNTINPHHQKGGHYHHHKLERFIPLNGEVEVLFEDVLVPNRFNKKFVLTSAVDVPPFVKHSLFNNTSEKSSIAIWADEPFNPVEADTFR